MFYHYKTEKGHQVIFAEINPQLFLRIFMDSPDRENRLIMPELNFIKKATFESNYKTEGNILHGIIKRIDKITFLTLKSETVKKIDQQLVHSIARFENRSFKPA